MSARDDVRSDLQRLQAALKAVAADLDAVERRPHSLRQDPRTLGRRSRGIEGFVDHFAVAVERSRSDRKS
jgi:hypothetical protein